MSNENHWLSHSIVRAFSCRACLIDLFVIALFYSTAHVRSHEVFNLLRQAGEMGMPAGHADGTNLHLQGCEAIPTDQFVAKIDREENCGFLGLTLVKLTSPSESPCFADTFFSSFFLFFFFFAHMPV